MKFLETRKCTNLLLAALVLVVAFTFFFPSYVRKSCVKMSVPPESRENIVNEFQLGLIEHAYDYCVSSQGVSR